MTFGQIVKHNQGMTPRVLSMRLRDLPEKGVIERVSDPEDDRKVHCRLTRRGKDIDPVLTAFIEYGVQHHVDRVFVGEKPRELERVSPGNQTFMLGRLARCARRAEKRS